MFKLLLGALQARDDTSSKKVHASDFQAAINQLGHNFGQPFVDKVSGSSSSSSSSSSNRNNSSNR